MFAIRVYGYRITLGENNAIIEEPHDTLIDLQKTVDGSITKYSYIDDMRHIMYPGWHPFIRQKIVPGIALVNLVTNQVLSKIDTANLSESQDEFKIEDGKYTWTFERAIYSNDACWHFVIYEKNNEQ